MDVFRLMAMPDRVVAFDGLPENLLKGFERCRAEGFPRHWKEWMGKKKVTIPVPPEKDMLTGAVRRFDPIIDEDSFFYLVDWTSNPSTEAWKNVCDYARQNVPQEFRLKEKIEDMALPLAPNKTDGVSLEPEDVVVIPLKKTLIGVTSSTETPTKQESSSSKQSIQCQEPGCSYEAEGSYAKNSMRFHVNKKHKKEPQVASA